MDEIIRRYKGKTTSQGYQVVTSNDGDTTTLALRQTGGNADDLGAKVDVAIIEAVKDGFKLSLFDLDAEEPTYEGDYRTERDLFKTLDHAVEQRSKSLASVES